MKFNREASATWEGTGMEGKGTVSTQSKILDQTNLTFKSRFEEGSGTNPEELIGAAHAGCFTMQLSFLINKAGYTATKLETKAVVHFENGAIPTIELALKGEVPNLGEEEFNKLAEEAKTICPISKLLNANIELKTEFIASVAS